jgi:hypothetical protein
MAAIQTALHWHCALRQAFNDVKPYTKHPQPILIARKPLPIHFGSIGGCLMPAKREIFGQFTGRMETARAIGECFYTYL